jgi:Family of unknown function (DUF5681)
MSESRPPERPPTGKDYVGYGCPPVATRFRPGDIGNPRGRPKKKRTVGQDLEEALTIRVKIEENGRSRMMTAQQVILRNLVRAAARGDTRAIHLAFALRERYQDSPETTLNPTELESEDRKILEEYFATLPKKGADGVWNTSRDEKTQSANDDKNANGDPGRPEETDGDASS